MDLGGENIRSVVDKIKSERDRFVAFAFASADILMEIDPNGRIVFVDGNTLKHLSKVSEEIVGKNFYELIAVDDRDLAEYFIGTNAGNRIDNLSIRMRTKTGTSFPFLMSGYRISELQGHFYLTFSAFRSGMNLADISRRDFGTGLLKKSEFCLSANRQLIMSRFSEKVPAMTLIYIKAMEGAEVSADLMKEIICTSGDLVKIQSIGKDTAGLIADGIIGFVHNDLNLKVLVEQLHLIIGKTTGQSKNIQISTETIRLAASEDISENDSAQAIMFTIDHIVENRGKEVELGTLDAFYAEMVEATVEKISEFRQTIEEELFDLAFQPIVEVETGEISHFEVLTRLRGVSKFSNPFQFIEFGEDIGMIPDYDFKMVCRSIDVLKKHKDQGTKPHLAINLSGSSLSSKLFLDKLYTLLTKNIEFCPQIMFEITESSKIGDIRAVNEYIRKLKKLGTKIGIDDFGAGEATFEYLRHLDVDMVKIDGSYLATKNAEDKEFNLLKSLSALCKDLGIDVIAERVETHEDKEIIRNCRIKYAQGYYYAKPNTDEAVLANTDAYEEKTAQIKNMSDYRA